MHDWKLQFTLSLRRNFSIGWIIVHERSTRTLFMSLFLHLDHPSCPGLLLQCTAGCFASQLSPFFTLRLEDEAVIRVLSHYMWSRQPDFELFARHHKVSDTVMLFSAQMDATYAMSFILWAAHSLPTKESGSDMMQCKSYATVTAASLLWDTFSSSQSWRMIQ